MKGEILKDIERINVIILTVGSLLILLLSANFKYFLSFALGSALISLNFRILKGIVLKGLSNPNIGRRSLLIILPLKFVGLLALLSVIIIYADVHVVYFLLGVSTVLISIIFTQIPLLRTLCEGRGQDNGT